MIRISELVLPLEVPAAEREAALKKQAAKRLKISVGQITSLTLTKQSVDARKKDNVVFRCTVEVTVDKEAATVARVKDSKIAVVAPYRYELPLCKKLSQRPVVVGFGPAGMFAALILAQAGQCPIVVERGSSVEERQRQVEGFWQTGVLNPQCNVQFGEGGAGTFSDGKLNTGTKDVRIRKVLSELHKAGAPEEILYLAHPHVGTDKLPQTVRTIRKTIESLGGEVRFDTQMTAIRQKDGAVSAVVVADQKGETVLETNHLVVAIGHSARDTYQLLHQMGLAMEAKAFSVGARIEHPQTMINRSQYGAFADHPALGAAEYKLAVHLPNGRGVYTFCMCPGGEVVASASEENRVVTNGMSNFARDGENANAALLVGITPEDFGAEGPLAGIEFQRRLETAAFQMGGGGYRAPAQRVEDFLQNRKSTSYGDVKPTYQRGVTLTNLHDVLPEWLSSSMAAGIVQMDKRLHGFHHPDALLTAVETRSSAPVRLLRNEQLQSLNLRGLYPCGEGAGYAGGIASAAVDGIRCAEAILHQSNELAI